MGRFHHTAHMSLVFWLAIFGLIQPFVTTRVFPRDTPPTVVDTYNNIIYEGAHINRVEKFFNIPYGRAERFGNPEAYAFPSGTTSYDASVQGPVCPQPSSSISPGLEQSEDCLRLKVARPVGVTSRDKLPVMVFIYGGELHLPWEPQDAEQFATQEVFSMGVSMTRETNRIALFFNRWKTDYRLFMSL